MYIQEEKWVYIYVIGICIVYGIAIFSFVSAAGVGRGWNADSSNLEKVISLPSFWGKFWGKILYIVLRSVYRERGNWRVLQEWRSFFES